MTVAPPPSLSNTLPATGHGDELSMAGFGAALIALGTSLVLMVRRPRGEQ